MSMHDPDMVFHHFQFWRINSVDKLSVLNTLVTCWLSLQSGLDLLISGAFTSRDFMVGSGIVTQASWWPAFTLPALIFGKLTRWYTGLYVHRSRLASSALFLQWGIWSLSVGHFFRTMLADLALYIVAMPQSNLFGMFAFPIGRIYTNVSIFQHTSALTTKLPIY